MNKQQKIKHARRMNLVDWLLILVALISVGVFIYFAFFSELEFFGKDEKKISVEYTVTVENVNAKIFGLTVPEENTALSADFIDKGDRVYDCKDGSAIGRVTEIRYEQAMKSTGAVDENGTLIYAEYPGYVNIIITISGNGIGSDGVYSINGYEIRVGSDIEFRTEGYTATGKCISVSGKEIENSGN